MKTIHKYRLKGQKEQVLELPRGSKILTVHEQNGDAMLWALVDIESEEKEKVEFKIVGTGWVFEDKGFEYVSTFQLENGTLVFHVFKKI